MANISFNDDISDYEPSDSETEYTDKQKLLLKKNREKQTEYSDSEEEVYGLDVKSSEDDSDIADSDIEGQDDDDLPNIRAWGKSKRDFYSTDYVDQDYGGFQGKDAIAAELEEEEAKNIQKRLTEQLDDDDFALDIFNKKPVETSTEPTTEVIQCDLSTLTKRELSQLLQKESPEFFVLVEDFKAKMTEIKTYLAPIIQQDKGGKIPKGEAMDFINTMYHLILNYCTNIYMYLLLKASKVKIKNHPILRRLYQYRQLITQLEPVYTEIIRPQIEVMIQMSAAEQNIKTDAANKLKLLKTNNNCPTDTAEPVRKKSKLNQPKSILKTDKSNEPKHVQFDSKEGTQSIENQSEEELQEEDPENTTEISEGSKRAITYQMAKNKGLTPHRKKEQRNPRVKHRNKFRKAKIRRKGAVREVRTETSRYGGEMSGIKASVSKSIKLK